MARGNYYYDDYRYYPPPSRPRNAKGGIKARSKRGAFGESWWAKRWVAMLEGFHIGARLDRGRNYARRGQVTAIEISEGKVAAKVQGSRARPYTVTIEVEKLDEKAWQTLGKALRKEAIFAARLLAGEMPADIEQVFERVGLKLFPAHMQDLHTACSCPDWSNPCKHVAAVYYLLGEEFDRDPFLIFRLRGMPRDRLMGLLGGAGPGKSGKSSKSGANARTRAKARDAGVREENGETEPLPADPASFWASTSAAGGTTKLDIAPAAANAALPRRLGGFPFWRGEEPFLDAMERIYRDASTSAVDLLARPGPMPEGIEPDGRPGKS